MKKFLFFYYLFLSYIVIIAQTFLPPVSNDISSDYGPRLIPNYDWHKGIDYATPTGTNIEAIEGGVITIIDHDAFAGFYVSIQGDSARWTYMHLFSDETTISPDGRYEILQAALIEPTTGRIFSIDSYLIAIKTQPQDTNYTTIFSLNADKYVLYNGDTLRGVDHQPLLTVDTLEEREVFGTSGNSGHVTPHLHISASSADSTRYDINPLLYVTHNLMNYQINISAPNDSETIFFIPSKPESLQTHERFKIEVNSVEGKDLNKVELFLLSRGDSINNKTKYGYLSYGGNPNDTSDIAKETMLMLKFLKVS